tara:strand:+ start:2272 stop:3324 length:1053 start_codon:yes stop_codon:yes gene_type:complete
MSTILSKSPYHINVSETDLIYAEVDVYIYTGTQTTSRFATPNYTLKSTAINGALSFDIGSLVNDAIQYPSDSTYRTDGAWLDYVIRKYTDDGTGPVLATDAFVQLYAVDGYSYFSEGANYDSDKALCFSSGYLYVPAGETIRFPINKRVGVTYKEFRDGNTDDASPDVEITLTNNALSGQQFSYTSTALNSVDRVQVYRTGGTYDEVKIVRTEECKYSPVKLKFVNRHGAMEDLWFNKISKLKTTVESKDYQNNQILSNGTYNTFEHQFRKFNTQARESMTINTGFLVEEMNESFNQLLMSSKVWMDYEGSVHPVNIKTSSIKHKTSLNDKLIQYTLEIDFAYNKINTIR